MVLYYLQPLGNNNRVSAKLPHGAARPFAAVSLFISTCEIFYLRWYNEYMEFTAGLHGPVAL